MRRGVGEVERDLRARFGGRLRGAQVFQPETRPEVESHRKTVIFGKKPGKAASQLGNGTGKFVNVTGKFPKGTGLFAKVTGEF